MVSSTHSSTYDQDKTRNKVKLWETVPTAMKLLTPLIGLKGETLYVTICNPCWAERDPGREE